MATKTQEAEELVVRNGLTGQAEVRNEHAELIERVGIARGTPEVPRELIERQLAQLEAYARTLEERTSAYVQKAMDLARKGPSGVSTELAEPIGPIFPQYPWWNLFVVGPFQPLGLPAGGPFLPHKIVQPSFMFIWCVIWRNPAPIDWVFGNPSAAQIMNGREYTLVAQMMNLSNVTNGPDIVLNSSFSVGGIIDAHLLVYYPPTPPQGRPDLYECNITVDTTEDAQPMAAFGTWLYDIDSEPGFLFYPTVYPQYHHERPMRFLVYRP